MGAQHLEPALVAEPLGHQRRVLDVAEQDRHRAVRRGVARGGRGAPARPRDHVVDRGGDVDAGEALGLEPQRERALDQAPACRAPAPASRQCRAARSARSRSPAAPRSSSDPARSSAVWARNGRSPIRSRHLDRVLELGARASSGARGRASEAEEAGDRARSRRRRGRRRRQAVVGLEQLVESSRALGVAERGRPRQQVAMRDQPLASSGMSSKPSARAARTRPAPRRAGRARRGRAPGDAPGADRRVALGHLVDAVGDLARAGPGGGRRSAIWIA